ncbi:MAG: primosomal protein N', partial [Gammaproteobacteria bacterium]
AARVVIGTRSAVFTPLPRLGLVVVDEEHDASLKQQDGFRYHARDLAVMRAHRAGVPALLGSATPTLEALQRVREGAWQRLALPARAGGAVKPRMALVDLRADPGEEGLSRTLLEAMRRHLDAGNQVLLFLNRRGWAPVLLCEGCGHIATCHRCDARLTWHARQRLLRCHHCGHEERPPERCPQCGSPDLSGIGQGTQRIEEALERHFPGLAVERIDRDSTTRRGALEAALERARSGVARILVGTQMLAKGHDFPGVTLVGMLDADQGLFSADVRAAERMAQLIVQVAGRAGRGERPGEVLIQTRQPDHPLLQALVREGYEAVAERLLEERRQAGLPPFGHLALLRAESTDEQAAANWLESLVRALPPMEGVDVWGPVPAPMARRAGRWRYHLLLRADRRRPLHAQLDRLEALIRGQKETRKVRWSLDVDPVDLY